MALTLPPKTVEALHKAFLASFPSEPDLRYWVQFRLGENLNVIKQSAGLMGIVLDLFYWIESRQSWRTALDAGVCSADLPFLSEECRLALAVLQSVAPPPGGPAAAGKDLVIWDGEPFVDRQTFWIDIEELMTSKRKRVALVNGPRRSGKSYCGGLLDHHRRRSWPTARWAFIDLKDDQSPDVKPAELCRRLLYKLKIAGAENLPPPLPGQKPENWARDLAAWLAGQIARAGELVWVLLDGFEHPDVLVETHVFLAALAAEAVDQDAFRLVLLDYDRALSDRIERAARRTRIDYISASDLDLYLGQLGARHPAILTRPEWDAALEFVIQYGNHVPGSATQVDALEQLFPRLVRALLKSTAVTV